MAVGRAGLERGERRGEAERQVEEVGEGSVERE